MTKLASVLKDVRACTLCAQHFKHDPRPVVRISSTARVLIIGQAPGTKVHASGVPWDDRSGDRLREWLGVDRDTFYDEARIAIMPMGFCFPGQDKKGGDLPPRPECAPLWHPRLLPLMPQVDLTILIGQYAQARYLGEARKATLTDTVKAWKNFRSKFLPLPHPSWRNTGWLKLNPWFEKELLPVLRRQVKKLLA
ncbi:MAG: uracil-DNA glycosylase family protein [Rhodospirillaceae bacterium]|nr:uracil-DNA glycosylase family protein [Rhodospirillaceae bacterium]